MKRRGTLILTSIAVLIWSCSADKATDKQWFKGNTHTHTTLSDGNASAEYVVNWYHERGYNFLVLTDHNYFIDPDTVKMPDNRRSDFILIPGEEVTGKRAIHTTGLNVKGFVHPGSEFNSKSEVIQSHVDSILAAGGLPIYNHPNFSSGAQISDIKEVSGLNMIELYNGHPGVYNFGFSGPQYSHIPVEAKWDSLLTLGMKIYGVAADDAHHYDLFDNKHANPGRGWVMVNSRALSADSIVAAMYRGDFYASNGVIFKTVVMKNGICKLEIDVDATELELKSTNLLGNIVDIESPGYRIEFIGLGGKILQSTDGTTATYKVKTESGYVRARAIFCRKLSDKQYENIFAWTQPVFLN